MFSMASSRRPAASHVRRSPQQVLVAPLVIAGEVRRVELDALDAELAREREDFRVGRGDLADGHPHHGRTCVAGASAVTAP